MASMLDFPLEFPRFWIFSNGGNWELGNREEQRTGTRTIKMAVPFDEAKTLLKSMYVPSWCVMLVRIKHWDTTHV